jgi:hypothetical protein
LFLLCRWEGPNGPLVAERGRVRVTDSAQLIISDVEMSDAGDYACIVDNMAATKSGKFSLVVAGIEECLDSTFSEDLSLSANVLLWVWVFVI